jgi:hypothetical protein
MEYERDSGLSIHRIYIRLYGYVLWMTSNICVSNFGDATLRRCPVLLPNCHRGHSIIYSYILLQSESYHTVSSVQGDGPKSRLRCCETVSTEIFMYCNANISCNRLCINYTFYFITIFALFITVYLFQLDFPSLEMRCSEGNQIPHASEVLLRNIPNSRVAAYSTKSKTSMILICLALANCHPPNSLAFSENGDSCFL